MLDLLDDVTISYLPRSFQLMIEVERRADKEFKQIVEDIKAGKTTVENEILKRNRF